jgi:transketolase
MNWPEISSELRENIIYMSHRSGAAHLASSLSCIDILAVLYGSVLRIDPEVSNAPDRDRFILSKGHAAAALYATLAWRGFISKADLLQYGKKGSLLEEHPSPKLPGVEAATGSLGHGLPIGNGMALAARIQKQDYRVFVLMSDGECNEGSVWEAAMLAGRHGFSNLTAFIDFNKWQATDRSQQVLQLDPLLDKWTAFGWEAVEIDGHNHEEIYSAAQAQNPDRPRLIVAHTIKGKGVSFMEDDNNWHYRIPTEDEVLKAKKELKRV